MPKASLGSASAPALYAVSGVFAGGKDFRALTRLVRFAIEIAVTFDIQLVLAASEVPPCTLGDGAGAARPGWIGWLGGRPARLGDADEVVLQASGERQHAR
ncbi:type VI secretion system baseplate subunit TssG [Edwardsiella anguillarum]|nr:type VI secretion system baseplate subunit TssG [Edwardsiella anguillarum]